MLPRTPDLLVGAGRPIRHRVPRARQLNRHEPDTAAHRVDENPFPRLHRGLGNERVVRRDERLGYRAGIVP